MTRRIFFSKKKRTRRLFEPSIFFPFIIKWRWVHLNMIQSIIAVVTSKVKKNRTINHSFHITSQHHSNFFKLHYKKENSEVLSE